mmetsp:Transcript_69278/g.152907  ORF Transcript_69278/g.152907 Transcript_69278/m.152907 type:complete len:207 (-) Transcript_69278:353-973(-)
MSAYNDPSWSTFASSTDFCNFWRDVFRALMWGLTSAMIAVTTDGLIFCKLPSMLEPLAMAKPSFVRASCFFSLSAFASSFCSLFLFCASVSVGSSADSDFELDFDFDAFLCFLFLSPLAFLTFLPLSLFFFASPSDDEILEELLALFELAELEVEVDLDAFFFFFLSLAFPAFAVFFFFDLVFERPLGGSLSASSLSAARKSVSVT